jgi:LmbE family N-acetylglucosaminyl deacetylase
MKSSDRKLLAILAHPDDESLGFGGTFTKYANEGVQTYLITATRGEKGRYGLSKVSPGPDIVGKTRESELLNAAKILQIKEVVFLDYMDGEVDQVNPVEIIEKIAAHIRRIKPQVILTFGPEGAYGHPDHIAISQFATAALVKAADQDFATSDDPHAAKKLYYLAWPEAKWKSYQSALKELSSTVDGFRRVATPYADWVITTRIDATPYRKTVWKAITCHKTQMDIYKDLETLPDAQHQILWGQQEFYRALSTVNGGRRIETDIFEGI